jgi:hypothetical protein
MEIKIGSDGGKSCQIIITGELSEDLPRPEPVLFFKDLSHKPESLRLDGIQFAIQEKMGLKLWWIMDDSTEDITSLKLLMPLESRGGYDFEKIIPVSSPDGASGLALTSFKVTEPRMSFFLMLDMSKQ